MASQPVISSGPLGMPNTDEIESGAAADLAAHIAEQDPHTGYQLESEREAASGYAGLDSSSKVIRDPANATSTATASKIPIADSNGCLDTWNAGGSADYGDGSDGDVVISTSATLTRDMFYNNLTISASGILQPLGFRIHVRGTLTIASGGVIHDDGTDGSGSTGGAALGARGTLSSDSGAGGNGRNTTGAGPNGNAPSANVWHNLVSTFAGGGGGSAPANAGGSGATPGIRSASGGSIRMWSAAIVGHSCSGTGAWQPGAGGGGGGGGGCNVGTGTATSGGGGSGGGSVCIIARLFNSSGTIRANGGRGGNASVTGDGVAGGGGGGGGGWVSICAGKVISQGTVQANGGTKGTGAGTGVTAASDGSAGFTQVLVRAA